jgi:hypothetical protein
MIAAQIWALVPESAFNLNAQGAKMSCLHQFLPPFFHHQRSHQSNALSLVCMLVLIAVLTGYAGIGQARGNHADHEKNQ